MESLIAFIIIASVLGFVLSVVFIVVIYRILKAVGPGVRDDLVEFGEGFNKKEEKK